MTSFSNFEVVLIGGCGYRYCSVCSYIQVLVYLNFGYPIIPGHFVFLFLLLFLGKSKKCAFFTLKIEQDKVYKIFLVYVILVVPRSGHFLASLL